MLEVFIKTWSEEYKCWFPDWFYHNRKPCLPRTMGYICQDDIDRLQTKNDVLKILKKQGKISCL